MGNLYFDRDRVESLRLALGVTLEELRSIRSTDAAAIDVMRSLGGACRSIEDWLPRVHDILSSTAMTSCTRSPLGTPDLSQAAKFAAMRNRGWEVTNDPIGVLGPPAPIHRTMDEVFADIASGDLRPMAPPLDANGRAGTHYEALTFAPSSPPNVLGHVDLTSNAAKFAAFWSDGLAVGWRETKTLTIYHLENVRVTKSVHTLNAFDRDAGPDTMVNLTTVAVGSGYMVIRHETGKAELSHDIGEDDPTANFAYASQTSTAFSGAFYPDEEPDFEERTEEDRFESPDEWTFTTSAAPMKDDWGIWRA
jgi:hypothetical protein